MIPSSAFVRTSAPALLVLLAIAWAAAILASPVVLASRPVRSASSRAAIGPYLIGRAVCHQRAVRSFAINRIPLPVCARCTGLYLGAPMGLLAALLLPGARRRAAAALHTRQRLLAALALAAAPTAITLALEWTGIAPVSNRARALAALPLSAAIAWIVVAVHQQDLW
jgi:uncharacterized membrane protein